MPLWTLAFKSVCGRTYVSHMSCKYLGVERRGYLHVPVVPSHSGTCRRLTHSHPQVTVLNFCSPAQLLLATTSISASGKLRLWSVLIAASINAVSSITPECELYPHFAPNHARPLQQGSCRPSEPPHSGETAGPQNLGVRGWRGLKLFQAEMPDPTIFARAQQVFFTQCFAVC